MNRLSKRFNVEGFRLKLLAVNTFMWITSALYGPFLSAYYVENGLNTMEIGIIGAVTPILTILIQPVWAFVSDYTNRRRRVLMIVTAGSAVTILGYLLCSDLSSFLAVSVLFAIFHAAVLPLCDALVTKVCAEREVNFAHVRMGGTIGYAIVVLAISKVFKEDPRLSFPIASLAFIVMLLFIRLLPKDEGRKKKGETKQSGENGEEVCTDKELIEKEKSHKKIPERKHFESKNSDRKIFVTKQVYLVLFLALIMNLGFAIYGYYAVYIISLGYDQSIIGLCSCVAAMSEIPVLMFAKKLFSRFGSVNLLIFAAFMLAGRILLVSTGILPLMILAQLFQSVTYMTTYYGTVSYISEHCAPGKNSQAQSCLTMVQAGVGSVLGSLLGGYLTNRFEMRTAFAMTAVSLVCIGGITLLGWKWYGKAALAAQQKK